MLETFEARINAANEVMDETGQFACPCVIFPEVARVPEIQSLIDEAIRQLMSGMVDIDPAGAEWVRQIGGEAAIGHALTVAAAAGYALAMDTTPAGESFDATMVDWENLPNIEDLGEE